MTVRIEARRLVPGRGDPIDDAVVLLDGDSIGYAGPAADAPPVDGAEAVRVDTVLPGLWDCHAHLFGAARPDLSLLYREPVALRAARSVLDLAAALQAGFTSIREAGGLAIYLAPAVAEGTLPGPRLYGAGAALSVTGGHADLNDLPSPWVHDLARFEPGMRVCDGVDDCMRAVREQLRAGAEVIKVCASGGVISERDDPQHQGFTRRELDAMVEVATMADRAVMAHCHGKAGMMAAIEAGVTTIEHGTYLDDEVCEAMVERGVLLVPTRLIVEDLLAAGAGATGLSPAMFAKLETIEKIHAEAVARAHEAGVRIALGTDILSSGRGGPAAWGSNARELPLMVQAGMTPLEAIEAATANAPATLGPRAPRSGLLAAGFDADVIAVDGDPTADVAVLADPANVTHVWRAGGLVHARPQGSDPAGTDPPGSDPGGTGPAGSGE